MQNHNARDIGTSFSFFCSSVSKGGAHPGVRLLAPSLPCLLAPYGIFSIGSSITGERLPSFSAYAHSP
jgi:hypothetical protein